jgi:hypothetical protein
MKGIIEGDVQELLRVRELLGIGPSGQIDALNIRPGLK